jgi:hypothetical protein
MSDYRTRVSNNGWGSLPPVASPSKLLHEWRGARADLDADAIRLRAAYAVVVGFNRITGAGKDVRDAAKSVFGDATAEDDDLGIHFPGAVANAPGTFYEGVRRPGAPAGPFDVNEVHRVHGKILRAIDSFRKHIGSGFDDMLNDMLREPNVERRGRDHWVPAPAPNSGMELASSSTQGTRSGSSSSGSQRDVSPRTTDADRVSDKEPRPGNDKTTGKGEKVVSVVVTTQKPTPSGKVDVTVVTTTPPGAPDPPKPTGSTPDPDGPGDEGPHHGRDVRPGPGVNPLHIRPGPHPSLSRDAMRRLVATSKGGSSSAEDDRGGLNPRFFLEKPNPEEGGGGPRSRDMRPNPDDPVGSGPGPRG